MNRIKEIIKKYFLLFDFIVCVIILLVWLFLTKYFNLNIFSLLTLTNRLKDIYTAIFNTAITIFGFLLTSISILFAFLENKKLEFFKETKHAETMFSVFFHAVICSGILALISFVTFFISNELLFWVIMFNLILLIARIIRVIWILKNLAYMIIKL